jgi:hypothetical protein
MSAVATFILRDLNRQSAKILAAVRKFGSAEITTRSGEVFTMAAKKAARSSKKGKATAVSSHFENLWAQQRALGYQPPTAAEWDEERFNRIIAGEE